jgi:hypothetical protein
VITPAPLLHNDEMRTTQNNGNSPTQKGDRHPGNSASLSMVAVNKISEFLFDSAKMNENFTP